MAPGFGVGVAVDGVVEVEVVELRVDGGIGVAVDGVVARAGGCHGVVGGEGFQLSESSLGEP